MTRTEPQVLPITLKEETLLDDSLKAIKILRPNWNIANVKSRVFNGGFSNKLSGFYLDGKKDEMIMVRIYGRNTEIMIDRQAEIDAIKLLHKYNLGAELYAILNNGICYEFVSGNILNMENCHEPKYYSAVAEKLAKVHSTIPITNQNGKDSPKSMIWQKIITFNELIKEILQSEKNADFLHKLKGFKEFGVIDATKGFIEPIEKVKKMLEAENMPITFCHNDLSLGNALYNEKDSSVTFIDYEWAMPNYAPFDVSNHLIEFAGVGSPDFSKVPDRALKSAWIAEYLKHCNYQDGSKPSQESFENWVELCTPLPPLFWSLWGIVQAFHSTIDYDYLSYSALCFSEYVKSMDKLVNVKRGN